jgi:hypothetical protein
MRRSVARNFEDRVTQRMRSVEITRHAKEIEGV